MDEIEAKVAKLLSYPKLGPPATAVDAHARMLVEYPYVILYEVVPDETDSPAERVEIVRVVHARRDISNLIERR